MWQCRDVPNRKPGVVWSTEKTSMDAHGLDEPMLIFTLFCFQSFLKLCVPVVPEKVPILLLFFIFMLDLGTSCSYSSVSLSPPLMVGGRFCFVGFVMPYSDHSFYSLGDNTQYITHSVS